MRHISLDAPANCRAWDGNERPMKSNATETVGDKLDRCPAVAVANDDDDDDDDDAMCSF